MSNLREICLTVELGTPIGSPDHILALGGGAGDKPHTRARTLSVIESRQLLVGTSNRRDHQLIGVRIGYCMYLLIRFSENLIGT